jgi:hypothetical protein
MPACSPYAIVEWQLCIPSALYGSALIISPPRRSGLRDQTGWNPWARRSGILGPARRAGEDSRAFHHALSAKQTGPRTGPTLRRELDQGDCVQRKMLIKSMVGVTGFEPATPTSRTLSSARVGAATRSQSVTRSFAQASGLGAASVRAAERARSCGLCCAACGT